MDDLSASFAATTNMIDLQDFRTVIEQQERPTLLVDRNGKIVFANEATFHATGMTAAELSQSGFLRLTIPAFRKRMMDGVGDLVGGRCKSFSIRCMLDIERLRGTWVDVRIERIDTSPISRVGFYVTLDVHAADNPETISSYDLLGMASHEIRSTLMALQGAIRMRDFLGAKDIEETSGTRQVNEAIARNLDKLLYISNDLIEYSSMETGRMKVCLEKVDLCAAIDNIAFEARESASARGIEIQAEEMPEPLYVWADPVRLSQVLQNLIGNSVKYCPSGTTVRLQCKLEAGRRPTLAIGDNGPGLPKSVREKIFMPFNRGNNARDARSSTGLGLRISQLLMQAMGGQIRLVDQSDGGTCFELELTPVGD